MGSSERLRADSIAANYRTSTQTVAEGAARLRSHREAHQKLFPHHSKEHSRLGAQGDHALLGKLRQGQSPV